MGTQHMSQNEIVRIQETRQMQAAHLQQKAAYVQFKMFITSAVQDVHNLSEANHTMILQGLNTFGVLPNVSIAAAKTVILLQFETIKSNSPAMRAQLSAAQLCQQHQLPSKLQSLCVIMQTHA
jgi:hypothetical protein